MNSSKVPANVFAQMRVESGTATTGAVSFELMITQIESLTDSQSVFVLTFDTVKSCAPVMLP